MRRPDPVVLVAALLISALAAAATAARAPSPWWAAPAFIGVAALVIGVNAALSRPPRTDVEQARDLVRQVSAAAGEIRARSLGVPAADTVAAAVGAVVEAAYRLAYLTAPAPAPLDAAIRRLRDVARRVDSPPAGLGALIEELALIRVELERAEAEVRRR